MYTVLIIFAIIILLLLAIYINHKIHLKKESALLLPLGQIVEVDGHNMSVYTEERERQLLFICREAAPVRQYWISNLFIPF